MTATHTALILAVPEAEPVVGALRARLDAAASWGVPAHITVLFPFLPPARADTVRLIAGRPEPGGGWRTVAALPLRAPEV